MHPGDLIAERFEIEHLAGSGGMGAVYRARDRLTREPVALKTLFGQGVQDAERFARESVLLAELRHPGVVRYITHGATGAGVRYLVMEWLEGLDLAQVLAQRGALPVEDAVAVTQRAAEALSAAHARGIVHRDVKPSNLFLVEGRIDRVRVLDFGIARVANAAASTQSGIVVGTPGYMAPEQARGEKELDARADVFSLGCVLFECLTGRAAFVGEHIMALLAKILLEDAPLPSTLRREVPGPLDRLVGRMLAKQREARPLDGAAVVTAIAELGTSGTLRAEAHTVVPSSALTTGEQRLLCVVTAGSPSRDATSMASAATLTPEQDTHGREALRVLVGGYGGRVELLADGSAVMTLLGRGSATDQTAQAAKCALAMRQLLPDAGMSLATGRGVVADRWPVGEVIERAVKLLRVAERSLADPTAPGQARPIRIDEVTGGLLDVRFDVGGDPKGLVLRGEREIGESARTLLGSPTPCVGREVELRTLEAVFSECTSEPLARAVLVTAAAGVGKTRLRHEFLARLVRQDEPFEVWVARGDPMSAGSPFGLIAQAVRRTAGLLDGEAPEVRQKKLRARVGRHVGADDADRVSEFLGELCGVPFPDDDSVQLRAARHDAMLLGDQMRRAWEDFLGAECAAQPVLLVLEDLHWGDLPTVRFVDAALRNLQDSPLMVLALARPEVHDQFPKLWAGRAVTQMQLGELSRKAGEKLVRHVLGKDVSGDLVTRVLERAAGNAFYLEELIRAVAEGKGDALPETVLAMVQARLEALDAEARRVLRAAGVFGQVFWRRGVEVLLGGDGADAEAWLGALVDRELVIKRSDAKFPGEDEFTFRHALVREAAYAMLTDGDRVVGHRLAGGWLVAAGESDPMTLAEHFERGAEPLRAVEWYRRAAEQALGGNDFAAAIERAKKGLACGAAGDVRAALLVLEAEAHGHRGELAMDETCALEALEHAPRGSALWFEAAGVAALACGKLGNVTRLVELADQVLQAAQSSEVRAANIIAALRITDRLLFAARYDLADALLRDTEERAGSLVEREPAVVARMHQIHASRARVAGDVGECVRLAQTAVEALERIGDLRALCAARANLGNDCAAIGQYRLAELTLRDAKGLAERLSLPGPTALAAHNLGLVLARLDKLDEARATETLAIEAYLALGNRRMVGACRIYLALIAEAAGDDVAAEGEARAAVEALASTPALHTYALAALAQVLLRLGRTAEGSAMAGEAMERLDKLGEIDAGAALVRLVSARARILTGDAAAPASLRVARDRLLARAARIREPEWQRSFLEAVPENSETLALANQLCGT